MTFHAKVTRTSRACWMQRFRSPQSQFRHTERELRKSQSTASLCVEALPHNPRQRLCSWTPMGTLSPDSLIYRFTKFGFRYWFIYLLKCRLALQSIAVKATFSELAYSSKEGHATVQDGTLEQNVCLIHAVKSPNGNSQRHYNSPVMSAPCRAFARDRAVLLSRAEVQNINSPFREAARDVSECG